MSTVEVSVSRYSLTVDTAVTVEALLGMADNEQGSRLLEALDIALRSTAAYAVPADRTVTHHGFRPDAETSPDMPCLTGPSTLDVLQQLGSAGLLTVRTELREETGTTYLVEGRIITSVNVVKPFAVACVEYEFSRDANSRAVQHGHAYADRWTITHLTDTVPEGCFLVAEIDDIGRTPELVGVAGFHELSDDVIAWLYELEGFGATTCLAGCEHCGGRWHAESGSWEFRPDDSNAEPWAYDDADDFGTGTIACPECRVGRVGFNVY